MISMGLITLNELLQVKITEFENNCLLFRTAIIRHICNNYTNNLLMGADTSQISQGFSWLHWAVSVLHRYIIFIVKITFSFTLYFRFQFY